MAECPTVDELRDLLKRARDALDDALAVHIYREDEKIPEDDGYLLLIQEIDKAIRPLPETG